MVSHCANPGCRVPFLYLRDGRLFAVPQKNSPARIEYFWLCGDCAAEMELEFGQSNPVPTVVPRSDRDGASLGTE